MPEQTHTNWATTPQVNQASEASHQSTATMSATAFQGPSPKYIPGLATGFVGQQQHLGNLQSQIAGMLDPLTAKPLPGSALAQALAGVLNTQQHLSPSLASPPAWLNPAAYNQYAAHAQMQALHARVQAKARLDAQKAMELQWRMSNPILTNGDIAMQSYLAKAAGVQALAEQFAQARDMQGSLAPNGVWVPPPPLNARKRLRPESTKRSSSGTNKQCQRPGCTKCARGSTLYCIAHGGGKRCEHAGCTKSAQGPTPFCIAHGGGRRCQHDKCTKSARGASLYCRAHGGGRRCAHKGCTKSAVGATSRCISHGGGRRCSYASCARSAQGKTSFCKAHYSEIGELEDEQEQSDDRSETVEESKTKVARTGVEYESSSVSSSVSGDDE